MATITLSSVSTATAAPRLTYGHAAVTDTGDAYYLGYPLCLSATQTRLLAALISAAMEDPNAILTAEQLALAVAETAAERALPSAAAIARVPGHVARINEKALAVGGRRLILSHPRRGYRLNPYM